MRIRSINTLLFQTSFAAALSHTDSRYVDAVLSTLEKKTHFPVVGKLSGDGKELMKSVYYFPKTAPQRLS